MSSKFAVFVAAFLVGLVQATGTQAAAQQPADTLTRIRSRLDAPARVSSLDRPVQETREPKPRRDTPWNGLLVGAVLGATLGFSTYTPCDPQPPAKVCEGNLTNSRGMETAVAAALFGAVGLTVDLLMQRSPSAHRPDRRRERRFRVTASPDRVSARFVAPF